jgi:hypothetical protein
LRTGGAQVVHQIPAGDLGQDGPRR